MIVLKNQVISRDTVWGNCCHSFKLLLLTNTVHLQKISKYGKRLQHHACLMILRPQISSRQFMVNSKSKHTNIGVIKLFLLFVGKHMKRTEIFGIN
jgi:hypothetical protein